MIKPFWDIGIPTLFVACACYFYCRALGEGIACARDTEHRMTLQSPWFFFMREFRPRIVLISIGLIPWLFYGAFLCSHDIIIRAWAFGADLQPDSVIAASLKHALTRLLPQNLYMASLSFSVITLLAPRINRIWVLTSISTLVVFASIIIPFKLWLNGIIPLYMPYNRYLACFGMVSLLLTWLYIRFVLNRAWFRFDD